MSGSEIQSPQSYEPEDIQQILQIALAQQNDQQQGELSKEQLWEIAEDLNISRDCLQAAEQDWFTKKITQQKRRAFNEYRQDQLKQKGIKCLILNGLLISLDFINAHHLSWSLYILLLWSSWFALNVWKTYQSKGEEYEEAFRSWERRSELKQIFSNIRDSISKAWQN